jgi:hypothetical protein
MIANEHIRIGNNLYEKVKTFKYLGYSRKKNIDEVGYSSYYSVQIVFSPLEEINNKKI